MLSEIEIDKMVVRENLALWFLNLNLNFVLLAKEAIRIADKLYCENEVDQLYEHLKPYESSNNSEIIWRLARATCDKAKSTSDPALRKKLMYEAFGYAEKALSLGKDKDFACHKVTSLLKSCTCFFSFNL